MHLVLFPYVGVLIVTVPVAAVIWMVARSRVPSTLPRLIVGSLLAATAAAPSTFAGAICVNDFIAVVPAAAYLVPVFVPSDHWSTHVQNAITHGLVPIGVTSALFFGVFGLIHLLRSGMPVTPHVAGAPIAVDERIRRRLGD